MSYKIAKITYYGIKTCYSATRTYFQHLVRCTYGCMYVCMRNQVYRLCRRGDLPSLELMQITHLVMGSCRFYLRSNSMQDTIKYCASNITPKSIFGSPLLWMQFSTKTLNLALNVKVLLSIKRHIFISYNAFRKNVFYVTHVIAKKMMRKKINLFRVQHISRKRILNYMIA